MAIDSLHVLSGVATTVLVISILIVLKNCIAHVVRQYRSRNALCIHCGYPENEADLRSICPECGLNALRKAPQGIGWIWFCMAAVSGVILCIALNTSIVMSNLPVSVVLRLASLNSGFHQKISTLAFSELLQRQFSDTEIASVWKSASDILVVEDVDSGIFRNTAAFMGNLQRFDDENGIYWQSFGIFGRAMLPPDISCAEYVNFKKLMVNKKDVIRDPDVERVVRGIIWQLDRHISSYCDLVD